MRTIKLLITAKIPAKSRYKSMGIRKVNGVLTMECTNKTHKLNLEAAQEMIKTFVPAFNKTMHKRDIQYNIKQIS